MSKLGDYAREILLGGLPAALDLGRMAGTATSDTRPEQTAPSPKVEDRDTSQPVKPASVFADVPMRTWIIAGVGGAVALGLLFFAMRGAARIR